MTLTSRLPDCPVGTSCRKSQNLDPARVCGFESELELRLAREWRLLASYLFADSRVVDASQQPGLGASGSRRCPSTAPPLASASRTRTGFNATLTARYVGDQYEDDLNTLPLGSYVDVDLFLSRAFGKSTEIYIAVENLLDRISTTGRTSEGVISTGEPRMARAGLRLRF